MDVRSWVRVIGSLTGWACVLACLALFINGLTRPDARVAVRLALSGAPDIAGPGHVVAESAAATFVYSGLEHVVDRGSARLGTVVTLALVAVLALAMSRHVALHGHTAGWATPSRALVVAACAVVGLGILPGVAHWVSAAAVLQAAGAPPGLSPAGSFELGWCLAGLTLLAVVSARNKQGRSHPLPVP